MRDDHGVYFIVPLAPASAPRICHRRYRYFLSRDLAPPVGVYQGLDPISVR